MLHRQLFLPIVRQRLVKRGVLVLRDFLRVSHPNRLLLVHDRPFVRDFLDRLLLLLLGFVFVFDLRDFPFLFFAFFGLLFLVVGNFLLGRLFRPQRNRVGNKLRVLLHQILQSSLLQILHLIVLQVQNDLRPSPQSVRVGVFGHRKRPASLGFPPVPIVVVMLGIHDNLLRD